MPDCLNENGCYLSFPDCLDPQSLAQTDCLTNTKGSDPKNSVGHRGKKKWIVVLLTCYLKQVACKLVIP